MSSAWIETGRRPPTITRLAWIPVNHAALHPHAGFAIVLLDDILGSVFVAGLVGTVLGLFPLRFMPGHRLASWHRGAWAAVFFIAVFGLVQVVLRPGSGLGHPGTAPVATVVTLFLAFGAASVGFSRSTGPDANATPSQRPRDRRRPRRRRAHG